MLGIAWGLLDGRLASQGAPGITSMTPRRALNMVYSMALENMDTEERDAFESKLWSSMIDLKREAEKAKEEERASRLRLAAEFGEVG